MKKWLLVALIMQVNTGCVFAGLPMAKVTYQVIDQQGRAVEGAELQVGFIEASSRSVKGITDTNGLFVAEDISSGGSGALVKKEGFHDGGGGCNFKFKDINKILNRFEPWNPTVTVVMKKMRNPVPMSYLVGRKRFKIPVFDQPVGFDLEKADFVAPYGKGSRTDFFVTATKIENVLEGATVQLTFPNKYDGILPFPFDKSDTSSFKWPYEAPLNGYTERLSKYSKMFEETVDYSKAYPNNPYTEILKRCETNVKKDEEINYIFRVRSQVDANGNLVKACYGKIEGDFNIGRTGGFYFRYWFNPDWTRNLEDDPQRNIKLD